MRYYCRAATFQVLLRIRNQNFGGLYLPGSVVFAIFYGTPGEDLLRQDECRLPATACSGICYVLTERIIGLITFLVLTRWGCQRESAGPDVGTSPSGLG